MKRFHVHVSVEQLEESIRFYSALLGAAPTVVQPDSAQWMLEEPRLNFAISQRGRQLGVNHLGFQVDSEAELTAMRGPLEAAATGVVAQTGAACGYALSDTYWITDPPGVAWETFHTLATVPMYGEDTRTAALQGACGMPLAASESQDKAGACCIPLPVAAPADKACCQ